MSDTVMHASDSHASDWFLSDLPLAPSSLGAPLGAVEAEVPLQLCSESVARIEERVSP